MHEEPNIFNHVASSYSTITLSPFEKRNSHFNSHPATSAIFDSSSSVKLPRFIFWLNAWGDLFNRRAISAIKILAFTQSVLICSSITISITALSNLIINDNVYIVNMSIYEKLGVISIAEYVKHIHVVTLQHLQKFTHTTFYRRSLCLLTLTGRGFFYMLLYGMIIACIRS